MSGHKMTNKKLNHLFERAESMLINLVTDSSARPLTGVSPNLFSDFVTAARRDLPENKIFETPVWTLNEVRTRMRRKKSDAPVVDKGDCINVMTCAAGLSAQIAATDIVNE